MGTRRPPTTGAGEQAPPMSATLKTTRGAAAITGVAALLTWFGREAIKAWFFDKIVQMAPTPGFEALVEYGPPVLFVAATLYFVTRHPRRAYQAEPNMPLKEVLKQIRGKENVFEAGDNMETLRALEALRERALHDQMTIFGWSYGEWRRTPPAHWHMLVRQRIPAVQWKSIHIDYQELSTDGLGMTIPLGDPSQEKYIGLFADRREVDSLWPITLGAALRRTVRRALQI